MFSLKIRSIVFFISEFYLSLNLCFFIASAVIDYFSEWMTLVFRILPLLRWSPAIAILSVFEEFQPRIPIILHYSRPLFPIVTHFYRNTSILFSLFNGGKSAARINRIPVQYVWIKLGIGDGLFDKEDLS